jgi:CubicO group peptidase (beta-lactamase class C family)
MKMTVHQLALLGQLCLQKGNWKGKQLISREAVTQATSPHVFTGSDYYGYFFRIAPDHFSIVGKWGQRCMIYPELGIVAAYLSDCPRDPDGLYETVHSYITHNFDPLPR